MNLIKKIVFLIIAFTFICIPSFADEAQYDGYIVKYKNDDNIYVVDEAPMAFFGMDSSIEYIIPDYNMELFDAPSDPYYTTGYQWNLKSINAQKLWDKGFKGDGVKVAVIDSGANDFGELTHCLLQGENCVSGAVASDTSDEVGHGTFVSGIIAAAWNGSGVAGIAPNVQIVPLKVVKKSGSSATVPTSAVISAIDVAIDKYNCKILNLSLGIAESAIINDTNAMNLWKSKILKANSAGAIVVAAAGNSGTTAKYYPAALDGVVGVGAVYKNEQNQITHAPYSQINESIFVVAPGGAVIKNASGQVTYSDYILSVSNQNTNVVGNAGTSFSAPTIAAVAALVVEKIPNLDQKLFEKILKRCCRDMGEAGYDTTYGYGLVDCEKLAKIESFIEEFTVATGKKYQIYNLTGSEKTFDFLSAYYGADGRLENFKIYDFKVGANDSEILAAPDDEKNIFVIDDDIINPVGVMKK